MVSKKKLKRNKDSWVFVLCVARESERDELAAKATAAGMTFQDWCMSKLRAP